MIRFSLLWLTIFIIFPFVWQRCILSNFDQLISTLSPNGIILNSSHLNPLLPITETTYIDRFGGFCWFQLAYWTLWLTALALSLIPACLSASFGWLLWCFCWFQLAYRLFWLTALGAFSISACLLGYFGWPLWGLFLFQLAYWAISVDCFGAFADSSLLIGLFGWPLWRFCWFQLAYWLLWLTALAFSLIPACLLASSVDCFGTFADSSLPIGFFGWLLWRFRWFQLVSPLYISCY